MKCPTLTEEFHFLLNKSSVRNSPTLLLNSKLLLQEGEFHTEQCSIYVSLRLCPWCYNHSSLILKTPSSSPSGLLWSPHRCSASHSNPQQSPLVLAISCEQSLKLFWSLFRIPEQQTDLVPGV